MPAEYLYDPPIAILGMVSRKVALVLAGFLAGSLGFAGGSMLATTLPDPSSGDTQSPQLALALLGISLVVAATALGVAVAARWAPLGARLVGWLLALLGFGGLAYLVLATLFVAGAFPAVLLEPSNLTAGLWLAITGVTGAGLVRLRPGGSDDGSEAQPWLSRTAPVLVGVLLGVFVGALWYAVIYQLIPYECCFQ
jgi:hypothetical protein